MASASAKSGDATVASAWPRLTRAPGCARIRETGPDTGESTAVEWSPLTATVPVVMTDAVKGTARAVSVLIWARWALSSAIGSEAAAAVGLVLSELAASAEAVPAAGLPEQAASAIESPARAGKRRVRLADMLVSGDERVERRRDGALKLGPRAAGCREGIGVLAFGVEQGAPRIER